MDCRTGPMIGVRSAAELYQAQLFFFTLTISSCQGSCLPVRRLRRLGKVSGAGQTHTRLIWAKDNSRSIYSEVFQGLCMSWNEPAVLG